jgi:hypothetical protein
MGLNAEMDDVDEQQMWGKRVARSKGKEEKDDKTRGRVMMMMEMPRR